MSRVSRRGACPGRLTAGRLSRAGGRLVATLVRVLTPLLTVAVALALPLLLPPAAESAVGPLRLVALGDSVPAAQHCPGCLGYVPQLAHDLADATGRRVGYTNLAYGGYTSAATLRLLSTPRAASVVAAADAVVITVGYNDINGADAAQAAGSCSGMACYAPVLPGIQQRLRLIVARVRALRGQRPTAIRVTDYYNSWYGDRAAARAHGGTGYWELSRTFTDALNEAITRGAQAAGARVVHLAGAFNGPDERGDAGRLLAADHDHPNQAGHDLIARLVAAAGWAPIR